MTRALPPSSRLRSLLFEQLRYFFFGQSFGSVQGCLPEFVFDARVGAVLKQYCYDVNEAILRCIIERCRSSVVSCVCIATMRKEQSDQ